MANSTTADTMEKPLIPVTVVTGFLGAGKTTLLQGIIRNTSKRIAIIQNEVSEEMGIESAVLTDSDGRIIPDFYELPNGCICCTSKDDLVTTLENIVNLGRERIDAIVVETTGIADPCTIVEVFWLDQELSSSLYLDGVVTVVDCMHFPQVICDDHFLEHSEIGRKQVAIADRVLLNKTDLVSPETVEDVRCLIRSFNPEADVMTTSLSVVDPSWVMSIGSYSSRPSSLTDHNHVLSTVDHVYLKFSSEVQFNKSTIERALGDMLWEPSETMGNIYRSKGLFRGPNNVWYSLQSVGALFEVVEQPSASQIVSTGESRFLFIGTKLNESLIREKMSS